MSGVDSLSSNLSTLSYPRTGKRGVPQQFARRLYEMLQSEAKLASQSKDEDIYISWSESGFAFRIHDVEGFTSSVLPKYFRTKKFSSFQRNLNLVSSHESSKESLTRLPSFDVRQETVLSQNLPIVIAVWLYQGAKRPRHRYVCPPILHSGQARIAFESSKVLISIAKKDVSFKQCF